MKFFIVFLITCGGIIFAENSCKQTLKSKFFIVSGQKAPLGDIPWQVILSRKPNKGFFCGGSIIGTEWVLTAAHCTHTRKTINLSFGSVHLKDIAPTMISETFTEHPFYNPNTLENDVSIIKLPTPLEFSSTIKPIKLVPRSQSENLFLSWKALISGFGFTNDEILDYSNDLLYAFVVVVPNKVCTDFYGPSAMTESGICAKGFDGTNQNICSGDSGGALVVSINEESIQIGINSYGAENKCTKSHPSGFVRVGSFLDFISQVTGIGDSGGALVVSINVESIQIGINSYAAENKYTKSHPSGFVRVDSISQVTGIFRFLK